MTTTARQLKIFLRLKLMTWRLGLYNAVYKFKRRLSTRVKWMSDNLGCVYVALRVDDFHLNLAYILTLFGDYTYAVVSRLFGGSLDSRKRFHSLYEIYEPITYRYFYKSLRVQGVDDTPITEHRFRRIMRMLHFFGCIETVDDYIRRYRRKHSE